MRPAVRIAILAILLSRSGTLLRKQLTNNNPFWSVHAPWKFYEQVLAPQALYKGEVASTTTEFCCSHLASSCLSPSISDNHVLLAMTTPTP